HGKAAATVAEPSGRSLGPALHYFPSWESSTAASAWFAATPTARASLPPARCAAARGITGGRAGSSSSRPQCSFCSPHSSRGEHCDSLIPETSYVPPSSADVRALIEKTY